MARYTRQDRQAAREALRKADAAVNAHKPTHRDSARDSEFQRLNDAAWQAARHPALKWWRR